MKLILYLDQKFIIVVKSEVTIEQGRSGQGHIHLGQGHITKRLKINIGVSPFNFLGLTTAK